MELHAMIPWEARIFSHGFSITGFVHWEQYLTIMLANILMNDLTIFERDI